MKKYWKRVKNKILYKAGSPKYFPLYFPYLLSPVNLKREYGPVDRV